MYKLNPLYDGGKFFFPWIACANSLDPNQAQQTVGLDLRSKLVDNLIVFLQGVEENGLFILQII